MPTDKFIVSEKTARQLIDEFFKTRRSSIIIKKQAKDEFELVLKGRK